MFTTGRIVFIIFFVTVFVAGLIWSYRKEKHVNQQHFGKSYKILIAILVFLFIQFLIVKIGHLI
ncbi:MAG: hypothetical protein IT236_17520 [Bacteroidia bacterium]|nr:hypothetical protein [Bacteroidia bacterium]